MKPSEMEEGKWYVIIYRRFGGRVYDQWRAQYLGRGRYSSEEYIFSLRPLAGTQQLDAGQIIHVAETKMPGEPEIKRGSMAMNARIEARLGLSSE